MIWHNSTENDVISELATDIENGLSSAEAEARLRIYGKNEYHNKNRKDFIYYILSELKTLSKITLVVTAIIFLVVTLVTDLAGWAQSIPIILFTLIISVISGALRFYSERQLDKLQNSISSNVTVIRDGTETVIHSSFLVPGDIMVLKTGDYIKADGRLIDSYALACDEVHVTGETAPAEKHHDALFEDITPLSDRHNMVYCSSAVLNGRGLAVVTETAFNTEVGMRKDMAMQVDTEQTVIEDKLGKTHKTTYTIAIICSIIIFILNVIANFNATHVSFAVIVTGSLLLAASVYVSLSSGLIPALIIYSRAASSVRLGKSGIFVTDARMIETLKDITLICTDKTGAITTEQHSVVKIFNGSKTIDLTERDCDESSVALLRLALICSNFSHDEHAERHSNNMERAIETACIEHAAMSKTDIDGLFPKLAELPFDSERMLMTTVTVINGSPVAIIKGAPEIVASRSINTEPETIEKISAEYAKDGLKVLAVAIKPLDEIPANPNSDELENELTFVGILGIEDAIDRQAVALCRECAANQIRTIMVTGDHFDTAVAIGIKAGIINDQNEAISGEKLAELDDEQLTQEIDKYSVFARISPEDKLRIVAAFKSRGEKVLVTGDSINDTQALLEADFGCALGKTASDIVKDSADIVISDNRFSSIVTALKESARIFINIKKSLAYIFTLELTILVSVIFGLFIFGQSTLTPSSVIFIGIIGLFLPIIAFFTESSNASATLAYKGVNIFDKAFVLRFTIPTLYISVMSLISFGIGDGRNIAAAFAVIGLSEIAHAFCISHSKTLFTKRILAQKTMPIFGAVTMLLFIIAIASPIGQILSLGNITATGWTMAIISIIGTVIIDEVIKVFEVYINN